MPHHGNLAKDAPVWMGSLAARVVSEQGVLFADGSDRKHFCLVTNRDGNGLDLIRGRRKTAGTTEPINKVLERDLAAPERPGLPEERHNPQPKGLRFLLSKTVGRVARNPKKRLLRLARIFVWSRHDAARMRLQRPAPLGRQSSGDPRRT